ncbi:MAG: lysophospholipase [Alphaproteobacteria bacterium]|nr:lysophospholipase [Alphaproteobacteria bacterium]
MFDGLQKALNPNIQTTTIAYPIDEPLCYDALSTQVLRELPQAPHVLVAESFSGPVALKVAARGPEGLKALILSASFAASPYPGLAALLSPVLGPWCFRARIPDWAIRTFLAGADASNELCAVVRNTATTVSPNVMAYRLQEVMKCDATADLRTCPVPIFYLHATKDRLLGRRVLRTLLRARPDVTVINVDGPHMLLQTEPDVCAQHIKATVDGLDRTASSRRTWD